MSLHCDAVGIEKLSEFCPEAEGSCNASIGLTLAGATSSETPCSKIAENRTCKPRPSGCKTEEESLVTECLPAQERLSPRAHLKAA